ncbi:MAG: terminase [Candidatus Omnitrophica bacterium]|nr:terminase [Candidatus Omnitrophota bacterium]
MKTTNVKKKNLPKTLTKKKVTKKSINNKSNKKNITGRPSKYDKIDHEQVKKLCLAGWTDVQMSDFFGVTRVTWDNWKKKHEDFFSSLKDWKAEADHEVEKSLYKSAVGFVATKEYPIKVKKVFYVDGKKHEEEEVKIVTCQEQYPPNSTSCIFWLKNRNPAEWRDRVHNVNLNGTTDDKDFIHTFFRMEE